MSDLVGLLSLGVFSGLTLLGWFASELLRHFWAKYWRGIEIPSQATHVHAIWGLSILSGSLAALWLIDGFELVAFAVIACSSILILLILCCKVADGFEKLRIALFTRKPASTH